MKAGTTSFHEMLNQHPDIFMSETKEINFFADDQNYNKGLDWYRDHFIEGRESKYRGESSVNYSKRHRFPWVSERIKNTLSDSVRIIYLLRDPIARFKSNFTDSKTYGDIPPNYDINRFIEEKALDNNPFILTSSYFYQLSPYTSLFPKEHIMLIEFEQLISNPPAVFDQVASFLDLPYVEPQLAKRNISSDKSYTNNLAVKIGKMGFLKKLVPAEYKKKWVNSLIFEKMFKESVDSSTNDLSPRSTELLKEYFRNEVADLKNNFGFVPRYWQIK